MAITDLFSKRQKRLRGDSPDVFTYDDLPIKLRVQIVQIIVEALGSEYEYADMSSYSPRGPGEAYDLIVDRLCREFGQFSLHTGARRNNSKFHQLQDFILEEGDIERVLDAVELAFKVIDHGTREYSYRNLKDASAAADAAISELNIRFQESAVGYRYENGIIVRVDNEFVHAEVVKPALALLHNKLFAGAEAEFLSAHEHYRHGKQKEALTDCLKALESTMKAIAAKRKWTYDPKATASILIALMFEKQVIPQFWAQEWRGLRSILENGVPTARNRLGGHGQGPEPVTVPSHIVAFVLHQTAAAIVFLVESEKALA